MNKVVKNVGLPLYATFVMLMAVMTFATSFVSDGPVPVYVHVAAPLAVLLIFFAPVLIWRRLNAGPVASPLPEKYQKYQDKIIVVFLAFWALFVAISYFAEHSK